MRTAFEARNSPRTLRVSREPLIDVSSRANEPSPRHSGTKRFAPSPLTPAAAPRRSRHVRQRPSTTAASSDAFHSIWSSIISARLGSNEHVLAAEAATLTATVDFVNLERVVEKQIEQEKKEKELSGIKVDSQDDAAGTETD